MNKLYRPSDDHDWTDSIFPQHHLKRQPKELKTAKCALRTLYFVSKQNLFNLHKYKAQMCESRKNFQSSNHNSAVQRSLCSRKADSTSRLSATAFGMVTCSFRSCFIAPAMVSRAFWFPAHARLATWFACFWKFRFYTKSLLIKPT